MGNNQNSRLNKLNITRDMIDNDNTINYLNELFDYKTLQTSEFYNNFFTDFIDLFLYCIDNNKFSSPVSLLNDNKIYRASDKKFIDFDNGFILVPYENDPPTSPFFFAPEKETANIYLQHDEDIVMCRRLLSITPDNKIILFIKFYHNDFDHTKLDSPLMIYFYKISIHYWFNSNFIDNTHITNENKTFEVENRYPKSEDKLSRISLTNIKESYGINTNCMGCRKSTYNADRFFINSVFKILSLLEFIIINLPINIINPIILNDVSRFSSNNKNNIII